MIVTSTRLRGPQDNGEMSQEEYLQTVENHEHRARLHEIFAWIEENFPALEYRTRWKQPMFLDHGTFIIGFSVAVGHLAVSPEAQGMAHFSEEIAAAGYSQTKNLFRVRWE